MSEQYYVVWEGRNPGIYNSRRECEEQVVGYPGAKYRSYATLEGAMLGFAKPYKPRKGNVLRVDFGAFGKKKAKADITIFAHGTCRRKAGPTGAGISVYEGEDLKILWFGMYQPEGNGDSSHLRALRQSIGHAKDMVVEGRTVQIMIGSKYARDAVTKSAYKWIKTDFGNSDVPREDRPIIAESLRIYDEIKGEVEVTYVRAHKEHEGNELACQMAAMAVEKEEIWLARHTSN